MSTTGRPEASPTASELASRLREAEFVRFVTAPSGDAVAATGLLAGALDGLGRPYQSSVVPRHESARRATDGDLTVALDHPTADADLTVTAGATTVSQTAFDAAREFDESDAVLALAGAMAAGGPDEQLLGEVTLERRPGVGVPTTALADGLAHSTLVHAPFSGTVEDAADQLSGLGVSAGADHMALDGETQRDVASLVALTVGGDDATTPRGATAVQRLLHPHVGGPLGTVPGYADVLDVTARERPGLAVPLALGAIDPSTVLDAWRDHAKRAHEAVRAASTGRYDGLFVARCDGDVPLGTVARLVAEYRSPEPVVLVVADGEAVTRAVDGQAPDVGSVTRGVADQVGGTGDGTPTHGHATFDVDSTEFVVAFREAV